MKESEDGRRGGIFICSSGSEHGRDRMHCPKREKVKEKKPRRHQKGLTSATGTFNFVDCLFFGLNLYRFKSGR